MTEPLTVKAMHDQITVLQGVFPKYKLSPEDFKRLVYGYGQALRDFDAEAVAGGVALSVKLEKRFPTPAVLREHIQAWLLRNRGAALLPVRIQETEGLCRVCRAEAAWAVLSRWNPAIEQFDYIERMIIPCNAIDHPVGSLLVPFPRNFVRWVHAPTP